MCLKFKINNTGTSSKKRIEKYNYFVKLILKV